MEEIKEKFQQMNNDEKFELLECFATEGWSIIIKGIFNQFPQAGEAYVEMISTDSSNVFIHGSILIRTIPKPKPWWMFWK